MMVLSRHSRHWTFDAIGCRNAQTGAVSQDGAMGGTVYLPTWTVDFYGWFFGKLIGKYTMAMDSMGFEISHNLCLF